MSHIMRKPAFRICETKDAIRCAVTVQLISTSFFATNIDSTIPLLSKSASSIKRLQAIFCGCTRFVSDLVSNQEDRFYHDTVHIMCMVDYYYGILKISTSNVKPGHLEYDIYCGFKMQ